MYSPASALGSILKCKSLNDENIVILLEPCDPRLSSWFNQTFYLTDT